MRTYEDDAIDAGRRLEEGGERANYLGSAATIGLGGAMIYGGKKYLKRLKDEQDRAVATGGKINPKLWARTGEPGEPAYYRGPLRPHHGVLGAGLAIGGGYVLAKYLKKRQRDKEDRQLREKYAAYDRDLLEADMERRRARRDGPGGALQSRLAQRGAEVTPDLMLRMGIPAALTFAAPDPLKAPLGAASTFLGNVAASARENRRQIRRLGQVEEISQLSDEELRNAHKKLIGIR